jgi:hypothetical protein
MESSTAEIIFNEVKDYYTKKKVIDRIVDDDVLDTLWEILVKENEHHKLNIKFTAQGEQKKGQGYYETIVLNIDGKDYRSPVIKIKDATPSAYIASERYVQTSLMIPVSNDYPAERVETINGKKVIHND